MNRKIAIFDPCDEGHHAGYILNFLRSLAEEAEPADILLVVSDTFQSKHPDVVQFADKALPNQISWKPLSEKTSTSIREAGSPWKRGLLEWQAMTDALRYDRPDHLVLMYMDFMLMPMAMGLKAPCDCSGLVFRQNKHYREKFGATMSASEKVMSECKFICLQRALANPTLKRCLSLDPYLESVVTDEKLRAKIRHIPDPVRINDLDAGLTVHRPYSSRTTLFLFGIISKRKGFGQFLKAAAKLSPKTLERLDFWLVGPSNEEDAEAEISEASQVLTDFGAIVRREDRFVRESEIQGYFNQSQIVVAPYIRHFGMSAVIVRAAAAGKPIIASDFGLMGHTVRANELGEVCDMISEDSICEAIRKTTQIDYPYNVEKAKAFGRDNSPEAFGRVIMESIGARKPKKQLTACQSVTQMEVTATPGGKVA